MAERDRLAHVGNERLACGRAFAAERVCVEFLDRRRLASCEVLGLVIGPEVSARLEMLGGTGKVAGRRVVVVALVARTELGVDELDRVVSGVDVSRRGRADRSEVVVEVVCEGRA